MWSPKENQYAHSRGGYMSSYRRRIFDAKRQNLEADSSTASIRQASPYTSEASWQVEMIGSANNT
jgi:hypothetical protein